MRENGCLAMWTLWGGNLKTNSGNILNSLEIYNIMYIFQDMYKYPDTWDVAGSSRLIILD
jgi:hypothetical protein